MEVYFKDLISKEASLDKLVDDLAQEADDFAQTIGAGMSEESRREVAHRADRLKQSCRRLKENAVAGVQATDRLVRRNPYASLGLAAVLGLLVALKWCPRNKR